MFIDYHTHHERCGHASGTLRDYIEQAIKKGLNQIGLSDHMPVIHVPREKLLPGLGMKREELEAYVEEALALKNEYKQEIEVKVGLEADYIEGYEKEIEKLLSPYPFDYIIGSVHFLGEWDLSDSRQMYGWKEKPIDIIFEEYYSALQQAVKSGLYDIVGHLDVVKRHGHQPMNSMDSLILQTLQTIKDCDMVMEINTSGLYKVIKEVFPAPHIIDKAVALDIPFTFGSDAHKPEHVHLGINEGIDLLKKHGIREIATFENRERLMVSF